MRELVLVSSRTDDEVQEYRQSLESGIDDAKQHPWQTCRYCNYDMHQCLGCGGNVTHLEDNVCLKCRNSSSD